MLSFMKNKITLFNSYKFIEIKTQLLILLSFLNVIIFAQEVKIDSTKKQPTLVNNNPKLDSLINTKKKEYFIKYKLLFNDQLKNYEINKEEIENIDYRVFTDVFNYHNFVYEKNLSSFGTPNAISYYGQTSNKISYFQDGIEINNRFNSNFDINNLLSESVNHIELIPLSRSFLFGNSNLASINFTSFEPEITKPFSRIKFFQAADEEGFFDGLINLRPFKNLITFFEISNQSYDGRFTNSSFSNWKGLFRTKYILNDKLNFVLSFSHINNSVQLNGGVDADSIRKFESQLNFDSLAFDNVLAPVRFYNRYLTSTIDRIYLQTLAKLSENNFTQITFFYQNNENYFRQNVIGTLQPNVFPIKRENYSLTKGFNFRSDFKFDDFDLFIYSNFERNQFNSQILKKQNEISFLNFSGGTSFNILNFIKQTVYAKFLTQAQSIFHGFGTDFQILFSNEFNFYIGLSMYKNPLNFTERRFVLNKNWNDESNIKTFETKLSYSSNELIFSLGYFYLMNDNFLLPALIYSDYKNDDIYFVKSINSKNSGLNLSTSIKFRKISLQENFTYYLNNDERIYSGLAEFENKASIFYSDILFNGNLNLKTGFNFYSIGNRFEQRFDFEKGISSSYYIFLNDNSLKQISDKKFSTSFKLDFFLIGTIQENAKVYVTWENLLDSKFFYIPYYPAYPRNIRIGVAWNFYN